MERWFYSNWLEKVDPETKYLLRDDKAAGGEGGSARAATAVKVLNPRRKGGDTEGGVPLL